MELKEYLDYVVTYLKDYASKCGAKGYVLGLSGGVDSSLTAALAKKAVGKENLMTLIMPIDSLKIDEDDAIKVAEYLDLNYLIIPQDKAYKEMLNSFSYLSLDLNTATKANMKARLRMTTLYAYAQHHGYLVLGTDNKDERYTGYFTKFGDGAADVYPLVHLLKKEVVEGAKIFNLPSFLAERVPSAGLFQGQTDEMELGLTYQEIDDYLLGKSIAKESEERLLRLHQISEHKRAPIACPSDYNRNEEK